MKIFLEPPKKRELDFRTAPEELFKQVSPPPHAISLHPLFRQYTIEYISPFYSGNDWDKDNLKDANEVDKWRILTLALANAWFQDRYRLDQIDYENYKENLKEWSKKNPDFLKTLKLLEEKEKEPNT